MLVTFQPPMCTHVIFSRGEDTLLYCFLVAYTEFSLYTELLLWKRPTELGRDYNFRRQSSLYFMHTEGFELVACGCTKHAITTGPRNQPEIEILHKQACDRSLCVFLQTL